MRGGRAADFVGPLILAFGVWLGFAAAGLPRVVSVTAPPTAFSAERAIADLKYLTNTPHPIGTGAHDRVRDYLVDRLRALGMDDVHVQSATGFNTLAGPIAATVANVVGHKRGLHPGPAVLLTAHYDAVPRSYGAGDDGAAVAAILETVRALRNGPPLDRDLMVVFSDAEEEGLLGAEAFVDLHPWAKDVGVVLNFDGRGDAGPVFMFQTSPGNAPLIDVLAVSTPGARSNSLTGEVYRYLPSDTDLSIWLHSGFAAGLLNFAHVGGYTHYHTPIDDVASLDPRIIQQIGDYALGAARRFGNMQLDALRSADAVYFNAPFVGIIHYPTPLALPLSIATALAALALIWFAARRKLLTSRGTIRGAAGMLIALLLPAALTFGAWQLIQLLHPGFAEILQRDPYNSLWYLLAFSAMTVAISLGIQQQHRQATTTTLDAAVAPMLLWSVLGVFVAVSLPGASYLLSWPLLGMVLAATIELRGGKKPMATALCAFPLLLLWPPLIKSLEVALTAHMLPLCALLAALVLSLLSIPLRSLSARWTWAAVSVAAIALVVAETRSGFTEQRKRPDSLAYLADIERQRAWWFSYDQTVDGWTANALGNDPPRLPFAAYHLGTPGLLLAQVAPAAAMEASPVHVVETRTVDGGHRVHLHLARSGEGESVGLYQEGFAAAHDVVINGRTLPDGNSDRYRPLYHMGIDRAIVRYFGVPEEGLDIQFTIRPVTITLTLRVNVAVEGLPATVHGPLPPRPATLMSKPFVPTDMTIHSYRVVVAF